MGEHKIHSYSNEPLSRNARLFNQPIVKRAKVVEVKSTEKEQSSNSEQKPAIKHDADEPKRLSKMFATAHDTAIEQESSKPVSVKTDIKPMPVALPFVGAKPITQTNTAADLLDSIMNEQKTTLAPGEVLQLNRDGSIRVCIDTLTDYQQRVQERKQKQDEKRQQRLVEERRKDRVKQEEELKVWQLMQAEKVRQLRERSDARRSPAADERRRDERRGDESGRNRDERTSHRRDDDRSRDSIRRDGSRRRDERGTSGDREHKRRASRWSPARPTLGQDADVSQRISAAVAAFSSPLQSQQSPSPDAHTFMDNRDLQQSMNCAAAQFNAAFGSPPLNSVGALMNPALGLLRLLYFHMNQHSGMPPPSSLVNNPLLAQLQAQQQLLFSLQNGNPNANTLAQAQNMLNLLRPPQMMQQATSAANNRE